MIEIVIPVYTRNELTKTMAFKSISQLRANTPDARIIIIDNGWHEDRDFGADTYVRFEKNQGYAHAVNVGLDLTETETVVVSSIDVFVPPEWAGPLMSVAEQRVGIASPSARRFQYDVDTGEMEVPDCVYWGGIFAVPMSVIHAVGGLDETNFPLRYADTDLGVRVAKAGFWVGRVTEVVVEHRDPSISTLFMPRGEIDAELEKLQTFHGAFPMHEWHLGHFQ